MAEQEEARQSGETRHAFLKRALISVFVGYRSHGSWSFRARDQPRSPTRGMSIVSTSRANGRPWAAAAVAGAVNSCVVASGGASIRLLGRSVSVPATALDATVTVSYRATSDEVV